MAKKGLPPVWVINLKRSKNRKAVMQQQLKQLGLKYEFVEAVDGNLLSSEETAKFYSKNKAMKRGDGLLFKTEIGCSLSHKKVMERIVEEDIKEVLVLEDDVFLSKSILNILCNRDKLPKDYELINFLSDTKQKPFGKFIYDIYRAANFVGIAWRTSALLVTKQAAIKLLKHTDPIYLVADAITGNSRLTDVVLYGIDPNVATIKYDDESTISRETDFLVKFNRELVNEKRHLFATLKVLAKSSKRYLLGVYKVPRLFFRIYRKSK